jgi:hypothetical protein
MRRKPLLFAALFLLPTGFPAWGNPPDEPVAVTASELAAQVAETLECQVTWIDPDGSVSMECDLGETLNGISTAETIPFLHKLTESLFAENVTVTYVTYNGNMETVVATCQGGEGVSSAAPPSHAGPPTPPPPSPPAP